MRKYLFPTLLIVGVVIGVSTLILFEFGFASAEQINAYYGKLLQRRALKGISGPHFWKDGKIFWAGDRYLESSGDLGATSTHEAALPASWRAPALSVSEFVLADRDNVYVKVDGQFQKVLTGFRCWYICGSRLKSGDFVIGEYGNRIYRVNAKTGEATLILTKPVEARHFHVTAVDPFTNDIYTSLGDALKKYKKLGDRVTGIMRSQDEGRTWQWINKTIVGSGAISRQPTAIYFDADKIYFGTDSQPHGIFALDRSTGIFKQLFVMDKLFHSLFTDIIKEKGSFWALSHAFGRSYTNKNFGILWWSEDGKTWIPVQIFSRATPGWLHVDDKSHLMSVTFREQNLDGVVFELPDAHQMVEWVRAAPKFTLLDRLFRRTPASEAN